MNDMFLAFDSDVVDMVFDRFGGKYTKEQIQDVLTCSVGYIHHIMTYTDCVKLNIPGLCVMYANKRDLEKRHRLLDGRLKRFNRLSAANAMELEAAKGKLEAMDNKEYDIVPVRQDMYNAMYKLKDKKSWSYIQKFQNTIQF